MMVHLAELGHKSLTDVLLGQLFGCSTDRNFVDKCSQQVMHFDHEATY